MRWDDVVFREAAGSGSPGFVCLFSLFAWFSLCLAFFAYLRLCVFLFVYSRLDLLDCLFVSLRAFFLFVFAWFLNCLCPLVCFLACSLVYGLGLVSAFLFAWLFACSLAVFVWCLGYSFYTLFATLLTFHSTLVLALAW